MKYPFSLFPAHLGRSFAFWRRSDDRRIHGCGPEIPADSSAIVKMPSCMGHAGRAEEVRLPLVLFRYSPSRFGPRRSAPDRPDSIFWMLIRSAHASRSPSCARKSASRTRNSGRAQNTKAVAQGCLHPQSFLLEGHRHVRAPASTLLGAHQRGVWGPPTNSLSLAGAPAITSQWKLSILIIVEIASANTKTPQANPNNYSYARITGDPLLMDYPVGEQGELCGLP